MVFECSSPLPEGINSLLDTDLYKLSMQCAVFKYYKDVPVSYSFTNRTPEKKFSQKAFRWYEAQVQRKASSSLGLVGLKLIHLTAGLGNLRLKPEEYSYLQAQCPYLDKEYLKYLQGFCLRPDQQIKLIFSPDSDNAELGSLHIDISGTWCDTILYEIPLLALASEAYFRFMDTDWDYDGQEDRAYEKCKRLLEAGCTFSEFGTRRRRDYHTQVLVMRGLVRATADISAVASASPLPRVVGKMAGTSNVHLAMRFNVDPVGTVAHEWFMGVAALTNNYRGASEEALRRWVGCFGEGRLGIALTDTFGTSEFLQTFAKPYWPLEDQASPGSAGVESQQSDKLTQRSYADVFAGVRQDSGDPITYISRICNFYRSLPRPIDPAEKVVVLSDSLSVETCLKYQAAATAAGIKVSFGVGTHFTNDFRHKSNGGKSVPLNIVIKLSSAAGRPAVKISDVMSKNTGDRATVERVKRELGYVERVWNEDGADEEARWGREDSKQPGTRT